MWKYISLSCEMFWLGSQVSVFKFSNRQLPVPDLNDKPSEQYKTCLVLRKSANWAISRRLVKYYRDGGRPKIAMLRRYWTPGPRQLHLLGNALETWVALRETQEATLLVWDIKIISCPRRFVSTLIFLASHCLWGFAWECFLVWDVNSLVIS